MTEERWRPRHRGIVVVLWLHVFALIALGFWWGATPLHSLGDTGLMACFAALASWPRIGRRWRSACASLGLVIASATLVHISGGYIEAHFHFFVVVVIIALYQEWPPFLVAIGYVLFHHGLVGTLDPSSVYNHPEAWAHPWRWAAIHTGFVEAISVASLINWRLHEMQEMALREGEARFRTLVEDAADGIVVTTFEGEIVEANFAAATMLGYRRDEMLGRTITTFMLPEDLIAVPGSTRELGTGRVLQSRRQLRHKDGSLRQIEVSAKQVRPGFFQGIWRDVTAQANAEAALRASEERFRLLAENAQDFIFRYRFLPTPGFDYVSPSSASLSGYAAEEYYADPDLTFKTVHPDDRDRLVAMYTAHDMTDEQPMRWIRRDGSIVWTEQRLQPVYDSDGQLVAVEGIARDVTVRVKAEEALRENERKYRTLVERAADGIALIDHNGILVEANSAALTILGYTHDEMVGLPLKNLVSPQETLDMSGLVGAMRAGAIIQRQRQLRHKDGTFRSIALSAGPLDDQLIQVFWRDVTAQAHAEAALRASEERFRLLAENAQDLIFRYRLLPTPGYDYVSPAVTRLLGYAPEEFYADPEIMFRLVHHDDRDAFFAMISATELVEEQMMRWLAKDGRLVWIEQRLRPIRNADGQLVAVEGISRDATERMAAEAALRDSEARARAIVETAVDAIVTIDERGVVLSFNSAAERLFGYAAEELVGRNIELLMHAPDAHAHHAAIEHYHATGERRVIGIGRQVTGRRKDGTSVPLDLAVSEVQLSGQRIYTGIMHDMTERVRLLEQERAARTEAEAGQRRMRLLADVAQELARPGLDLTELLSQVVRHVTESLGDGGSIRVLAEDGETLLAGQNHHVEPDTAALLRRTLAPAIRPTNGIAGRVVATNQSLLLNGEQARQVFATEAAAPYLTYFERYRPHSLIIAPLRIGERILGVLTLLRDRTQQPFDEADRDLVQVVADRAALVVENARLRQTEAALRTDEERFRSLYGIVGQATVSRDGRILTVNHAICEMVGYEEDELLGITTQSLTHPDDREVSAFLGQQLLDGAMPYSHLEKRFLHKNGGIVYTLVSTGVVRNAEGVPQYLIALVQDISERVHAEAALAESEARHRSVVAALDEGVVLRGTDWSVAAANANAARLLGLTYEQLSGEAPLPADWGTIHEDGTPFLADEWPARIALRTGEPQSNVTMGVQRPDGTLAWLDVNAQPLYHDGELQPYAVVTSFFDITDRLRAEAALREATVEAERANRAKSEFLSRMSHELRTPLNAILGFAQLLDLDRDTLDSGQQESIEHILKGGKHLLALINEILDLARIESGRLSLSPEPVEVREVLAECLDFIRPLAERREITLDARLVAAEERHVLADRQRLKQILLNLLSNAVKYNRRGGTVTLDRAPAAEDRVRLTVRDTGPGIPAAQLDRLFLPFERLGAEGGEIEGTGLGLAVARQLAVSMGGAIGLQRTDAAGSVFWFELPATSSVLEQALVPQQPLSKGARDRTISYTLLVVEDNPANLILVERVLAQRPGIQILAAVNGDEALTLARTRQPDLILLDQHLPGMPGDVVLRQLRSTPETSTIPVVIVSADATPRQVERLLAEGAATYLTKPIDVQALLDTVDRLLAEVRESCRNSTSLMRVS